MGFRKTAFLLLLFSSAGQLPSLAYASELVGRVEDANTGEAIAGATVRAIPIDKTSRQILSRTRSNGRYQLDLLKGKYRLFVSFPGSDYLPQFYTVNNEPQGDVIDVPTFDSFRIIDLTMSSGGSISGRVVRHSDRSPLPNIRVTVSSQAFRTSTTTRSDGSYSIRALPPGNYRVQAVPLNENFIPTYFGDAREVDKAALVTVERKRAQTQIDFRLRNGGMINGRVYANKNREPITGIKVVAENLLIEERPAFAVTDSQGFYSIRGLTPGEYVLETQESTEAVDSVRPKHSFLMQYHSNHYDREMADKLEIEPGTVIGGVDFALVEGGSLSGTVRSRYHNAPLGGVAVIPQNVSKEVQGVSTGKTGSTGEYKVTDLPPGVYVVGLSLPLSARSLVAHYYRDKLSEEFADKLRLEEGERVQRIDFNLPLGATLQGRIIVESSDYPIKSVNKIIRFTRVSNDMEGFGKREFKVEGDGGFVIEGTPPGRYVIIPLTDDPNLVPQSEHVEKTLDIAEGDLIENLDFVMKVSGSVAGKIAIEGQTVDFERYSVLVVNMKDNSRRFFDLNSENFLLTGLDQGKYLVVLLSKPEKMPASEDLSIPVLYDTRLVEVQRGKTTTDVSLHLNKELSFPAGMYR